MAVRELVAIWVKCETDAIGRASRGKGKARRPRGPAAVEKAEESLALGTRPTGERKNRPPTKIAQASRWRPPEAVRGSKSRFRNR